MPDDAFRVDYYGTDYYNLAIYTNPLDALAAISISAGFGKIHSIKITRLRFTDELLRSPLFRRAGIGARFANFVRRQTPAERLEMAHRLRFEERRMRRRGFSYAKKKKCAIVIRTGAEIHKRLANTSLYVNKSLDLKIACVPELPLPFQRLSQRNGSSSDAQSF